MGATSATIKESTALSLTATHDIFITHNNIVELLFQGFNPPPSSHIHCILIKNKLTISLFKKGPQFLDMADITDDQMAGKYIRLQYLPPLLYITFYIAYCALIPQFWVKGKMLCKLGKTVN